MSTVWSASSGYMFIGISLDWSGNPADGYVTVIVNVTACSDNYGHHFRSRWSWWGHSGEGSEEFSFDSGYGQTVYKRLSLWKFNVNLAYGRETTIGIGASLGPIWNGGNPAVENYLTLPARPFKNPNAPTSVQASRISDDQVSVTWLAPSSGEANPIDTYAVERRTDESSNWSIISPVKSSTSFIDRSVSAGHRYAYRVKAQNSAGGSGYSESGLVYTTPPAPVNVSAAKDVNGNIVVTWENKAPYTPTRWDVYDGATLVAQVPVGVTVGNSWTHRSPRPDVTHRYQVVCVGGTTPSLKSEPSNTVQLLVPPNAPEPTSDGQYFPSDLPVRLTWQHRPADSSPQTRYALQYQKKSDGAPGPLLDRKTPEQEATLGVLPAGAYEYWVRTWGLHASSSPTSRRAMFYVQSRPVVSIQTPAQTVKTSFTEVVWSYSTQGGSVQSSVRVELYMGNNLVETQEVRGSTSRVLLKTYLENGQTYRVSIVATNANGVESSVTNQTFAVVYNKPPTPSARAEWDEERGCVRLRVVNPAPGADKPAAVRNRVERSDDGGRSWAIVTEDLPVSGALEDYESISRGHAIYRVTATSALPSSSTAIAELDIESWAMWIGGGADFGVTVPLRWDPVHSCKTGLTSRKVYHFAGRIHGVEMSGRHREKVLSLSAVLFDEDWDLLQRLEELSYLPAPFMYRDPMGRRVYCSLRQLTVDRALSGKWSVKIEVEEVDQ